MPYTLFKSLLVAEQSQPMRSLHLVFLLICGVFGGVFFSGCAVSRTTVHNVNKGSQTVLSMGSSTLAREPDIKVRLALSGQIFVSTNCSPNPRKYLVEIYRKGEKKILYSTSLDEKLHYLIDTGLTFEGEIVARLVESQTSKILQEKTILVNQRNDRMTVNFDAC